MKITKICTMISWSQVLSVLTPTVMIWCGIVIYGRWYILEIQAVNAPFIAMCFLYINFAWCIFVMWLPALIFMVIACKIKEMFYIISNDMEKSLNTNIGKLI